MQVQLRSTLVLTPPVALVGDLLDGGPPADTSLARAATHQLVSAYWGAFTSSEIRPLRDFALHEPDHDLLGSHRAHDLGRRLAEISPLDASFVVGRIYTFLLPDEYRTKHGIYFTPPALTRRLLDSARSVGVDLKTAHVIDPACGGGAFLAPIASAKVAELRDLPADEVLRELAASVHGVEIDPFNAWLSQVFVDAVTDGVSQRAEEEKTPLLVRVGDALDLPDDKKYDLVIGNPPYGKVALGPQRRSKFSRGLYGHANLYGVFTDQAVRLTKPGGVIALVTPTSFLSGQYFKSLRQVLADEAPPLSLDFVSDREGVFDDVLQETVLATFNRSKTSRGSKVSSIQVLPGGDIAIEPISVFELPSDPQQPWLIPREARLAPVSRAVSRMSTRLSDLGYRVSTGPLVWNRYKDALREARGWNRFPLIWAEAVAPEGSFTFPPRKKGHSPYFEVRPGIDDHLLLRVPCVLVQRTTSKEQRRRLIAAVLPPDLVEEYGAVIVENHLNVIFPTNRVRVSPSVIAAVLNSSALDDVFRCISGSVAVSAFELEALRFPTVEFMQSVERALQEGTSAAVIGDILDSAYRESVPAPT